jgi:hypothetical protein
MNSRALNDPERIGARAFHRVSPAPVAGLLNVSFVCRETEKWTKVVRFSLPR